MPSRLERSIERSLGKLAVKHGCIWLKLVKTTGVPDRLLIAPNGRVVFIEVKSASGRLAPPQRWWRARLLALGHDHAVVRTRQELLKIIAEGD